MQLWEFWNKKCPDLFFIKRSILKDGSNNRSGSIPIRYQPTYISPINNFPLLMSTTALSSVNPHDRRTLITNMSNPWPHLAQQHVAYGPQGL